MNDSDIPSWVKSYIGLPFKDRGRTREGVDCWGLCRLVYAEQYDIDLPEYDGNYWHVTDYAAIASEINKHRPQWVGIDFPNAQVGDLILLRIVGLPIHIGVVVDPRGGRMLHAMRGANSVLERYLSPCWSNRILGFHRHDPDCR